ncbi:class I SAM-dependent methyltransferase [Aestuariivivens sediminis]|uniref:class I SAM-dependent methyltransferase n=1 Tax=Aestuariivivens sediminis TaxID=2913557 RepID=UPI001F584AB5|nr:class I SAM-dependent methyltransferase [Aestuariivivens sediminis]
MIKKIKNKIKATIAEIYENNLGHFFFKQPGFCPCCEQEVVFISHDPWLRDHFTCSNCSSLPRERALMYVIQTMYPYWKDLHIHESSPSNRGHSVSLKQHCKYYTISQFFPNQKRGALVKGFRNEDLEQQTFEDRMFDLVITSDVMEHVYEPDRAFKEIYRTLKPGGAHIFSVPLVNKHKPTQRWAIKGEDGQPNFLFEPEWHSNPIDEKGSPVTFRWGYDIKHFIETHTEADCEIIYLNDLSQGIRAEYIEIIVQKKKL